MDGPADVSYDVSRFVRAGMTPLEVMENSGNNQNQSRFLIAAVLSMVVLFGWSYFFAPKKPAVTENANVAANT